MKTENMEKEALLKPNKPAIAQVHKGYRARHTFCILAFFGLFNVYALRFNMSVAIVAMTNVTTVEYNASNNKECPDHHLNSTSTASRKNSEFDWDEEEQGLILSSFFYGYIVTQIPAGRLAELIGGKKLFGFSVLTSAVLTLLTPLLSHVGVWAVIIVRVVEGLAGGVTFPALFAMEGKWIPTEEKATLTSFISAGASFGNVVCLPLCGVLSSIDLFGGWSADFYSFGIIACVWWIFWQLLIHDTPADHPRISQEERTYIEGTDRPKTKSPPPWRKILTSPPVWALNLCGLSIAWGYYVMVTCVPSYMKRIQKFDIQEDGLLMALPNVLNVILALFSGWFADFLINKRILSTVVVRKLFTTFGILISSASLMAVPFVGCNHVGVVSLLTLSNGMIGFVISALLANILDIGRNFAGTMMGIVNFTANLSGIASPYLVGSITNHNDTRDQWKIVFFISVAIFLFGLLVFLLFARGSSQEWNESVTSPNDKTIVIQYTGNEDIKTFSKIEET